MPILSNIVAQRNLLLSVYHTQTNETAFFLSLHPSPLHLPVETRTRRIPTPTLPPATLHRAGHPDKVGRVYGTRSRDIGIGNGSSDTSLAPFSIEGTGTGAGKLMPVSNTGIIVVAFGVDDSGGVADTTDRCYSGNSFIFSAASVKAAFTISSSAERLPESAA